MAKGNEMKTQLMMGVGLLALLSSVQANAGDWRVATGLGSIYLDNEKHGYESARLDAYALDFQVIYAVSPLLELSVGYMEGVRGLVKQNNELIDVSVMYLDTHWKLSNGVIRPYGVVGVGKLDAKPEIGDQIASLRAGFGVAHELMDRLDLNFSYIATTASIQDAEMESMTSLGVVYTFE
ncbi:hypothetical protein DN730_08190 [Marinomonas piezotolerans]|uniref:Outer membrane protein beta-barrel domain-containing protein n=2 Tax=Marinomonas piezotolerans TaxID=2213058 RepID=A0A370U9C4_9GAMM|nr:hypothetical protein DN730_08190 [Marinomonas piezotolerans]